MGLPLLLPGVGGGSKGPGHLDLAKSEGKVGCRWWGHSEKGHRGGAVGTKMGGRRGGLRWQELEALNKSCRKRLQEEAGVQGLPEVQSHRDILGAQKTGL